jgi:hypothetical protein
MSGILGGSLAKQSAQSCSADRLRSQGCYFELGDTGSKKSSHTSVMAALIGAASYDLRFYK